MKEKIAVNEIIENQIEFRYEYYISSGGKNIVDRNLPLYEKFDSDFRRYSCFSELTEKRLGATVISDKVLMDMLETTITEIKKVLNAVKKKKYLLALAGMGGSGTNFIHWTYRLANIISVRGIFSDVIMYDRETFETSNVYRIPFLLDSYGSTMKVHMIPKRYDMTLSISEISKITAYINDTAIESLEYAMDRLRPIIYGAPSVNARAMMTESKVPFFAATHQDNRATLVLNPAIENDGLVMETYGKINLNTFFYNQLVMTWEFLKYLAKSSYAELTEPGKTEEIVALETKGHTFKSSGKVYRL